MTIGTTAVERLRPGPWAAVEHAVTEAHAACPDGLLELCRARIRTLLGRPVESSDPKLNAVADYARSDLFSETERVALELTEQYVLDVGATPDELIADVRRQLGTEGTYALVMGLYAVDQRERLEISTAVHPGGTP